MQISVEDFHGVAGWQPNPATERIVSRIRPEDIVEDIDWAAAFERSGSPDLPDYVVAPIHGVEGGYGNPDQAAAWDSIVRELFAEYAGDEQAVRDGLPAFVDAATAILDVGCGTAPATLAWARRFPDARVIGIDVSPYMLAVAERKTADVPNVDVRWANAEDLPFEDESFDVVTASLLFHELPAAVAPKVLSEMHRVLQPGGRIAVLEPYARGARSMNPLPFPEPFLKDYLDTDWDDTFRLAGFADVAAAGGDEGWIRVARRTADLPFAPS